MRDERTKLLTFVNTWMDGVPSNLNKSWQKWRMSLSKGKNRGEKGENRENGLGLDEGFIYGHL